MNHSHPIFITGIGQHSVTGQGVDSFRQTLAGEKHSLPISRAVQTALGEREVDLFLAPDVRLPDDLPESVKRRMARLSRMCFAAVKEAVRDAFGERQHEVFARPERIGLVVGTAFGCIEVANVYQRRVILEGAAGASPSLFASSIHNSIAAHLSISFGIQGPNSTVATMEQTVFGACRIAFDWLKQNQVDHAVVVLGDELSEYHSYVAAHAKKIPGAALNPLANSCTAAPGEGVTCFVLSRADASEALKRSYCELNEVNLFSERPPDCERYFAAIYGGEGQFEKMQNWLGEKSSHLKCHAQHYGSTVTGAAFELLAATLATHADGKSTACVELTPQSGQALVLHSLNT